MSTQSLNEVDASRGSGDISLTLEHLFRQEWGKMVATLTRIFGIEHLGLAEDVVQEALAKALQVWPFSGVPKNPSAWIMRVARNLALDAVRRKKTFREKEPEITALIEESNLGDDTLISDQEIADDRLRLIFACCHPALSGEVQVALALKTLCGFGVEEISRAFLTSEAAIAKRLTRARQTLREEQVRFEIPAGPELEPRLETVRQTLYLLFNEGYKASTGDLLIREDICEEAIRLGELLARHPAGDQPSTHALLALMCLNASRLPARLDAAGNLLRLHEQDRSLWDRSLIARGMIHMAQSAEGVEITDYHLQAAIASCHAMAPDSASTDWSRILVLYDQLYAMNASPVVALNRAVAVAHVRGPEAAIKEIRSLLKSQPLESYHLLYASMGEFEAQASRYEDAAAHFQRAMELSCTPVERSLLERRLQECRLMT